MEARVAAPVPPKVSVIEYMRGKMAKDGLEKSRLYKWRGSCKKILNDYTDLSAPAEPTTYI
jgi:hypothetical protein